MSGPDSIGTLVSDHNPYRSPTTTIIPIMPSLADTDMRPGVILAVRMHANDDQSGRSIGVSYENGLNTLTIKYHNAHVSFQESVPQQMIHEAFAAVKGEQASTEQMKMVEFFNALKTTSDVGYSQFCLLNEDKRDNGTY